MKNFILSALFVLFAFSFSASAQTGTGFKQFYIAVGSTATGFPVTTAEVPVGSTLGSNVGSTSYYGADGSLKRSPVVTFYVPLSPNPQTMENHYFISGICTELAVPTGYRKKRIYDNIYQVDNANGVYDNTNEYCVAELVKR